MGTDAVRDRNNVPVALGVSSADATATLPFKINSSTGGLIIHPVGASGTFTSNDGKTITVTSGIITAIA